MDVVIDIKTPMVPSQVGDAKMMVVLVENQINDTKVAFEGVVYLPDVKSKKARAEAASWVHGAGRKLKYDEAHHHFPSLSKRKYQK